MRTPWMILLLVVLVTLMLGVMLVRWPQPQPQFQPPFQSQAQTQPGSPSSATAPAVAPATQIAVAGRAKPGRLMLYCAAGLAQPIAAIAKAYEKETGVGVDVQLGGSGTLLANLRLAREGDLYLAADQTYIALARRDNLLDETLPLARMTPVLAVRKGNPKAIRTVDDLTRADVRVALANPQAASIGQVGQSLLQKLGRWDAVAAAVQDRGVFKPTVNEIANDLKLGTVDAGLIWDALTKFPEYASDIEAVPLSSGEDFTQEVTLGVLRSARSGAAALHLARYIAARDRGLPIFAKSGFATIDGDAWADRPRLLVYCGAVNRVAIQETLQAFERREGVEITTVFNGCGILNGQIKLGEQPDVYQTCDATFMGEIRDQFLPERKITTTDIVMLVAKGNPKGIRTPADLAKPGLKIGLGDEKMSTLGALTARLLHKHGLHDAVRKNVVATTPTADLLVNQIRTGSLDAVVVYLANTSFVRDQLDVIRIDDPLARAEQSIAMGKSSAHKQLVERLFDALRSDESRQRYKQAGFFWIGDPSKP